MFFIIVEILMNWDLYDNMNVSDNSDLAHGKYREYNLG